MKMLTNEERIKIALLVKSVWIANQPDAMDRSAALNMLLSNLQHEERENKVMIYNMGDITPDKIAEVKDIWMSLDRDLREFEFKQILKITEALEW